MILLPALTESTTISLDLSELDVTPFLANYETLDLLPAERVRDIPEWQKIAKRKGPRRGKGKRK